MSELKRLLEKYPNIDAVINGTVSGNYTEWPKLRTELIDFLTKNKELEGELDEARRYFFDGSNRPLQKGNTLLEIIRDLHSELSAEVEAAEKQVKELREIWERRLLSEDDIVSLTLTDAVYMTAILLPEQTKKRLDKLDALVNTET